MVDDGGAVGRRGVHGPPIEIRAIPRRVSSSSSSAKSSRSRMQAAPYTDCRPRPSSSAAAAAPRPALSQLNSGAARSRQAPRAPPPTLPWCWPERSPAARQAPSGRRRAWRCAARRANGRKTPSAAAASRRPPSVLTSVPEQIERSIRSATTPRAARPRGLARRVDHAAARRVDRAAQRVVARLIRRPRRERHARAGEHLGQPQRRLGCAIAVVLERELAAREQRHAKRAVRALFAAE